MCGVTDLLTSRRRSAEVEWIPDNLASSRTTALAAGEITMGVLCSSCPVPASEIDLDEGKRTFPDGTVKIDVVPGGMMIDGGAMGPEFGDRSDDIFVINAAVEIGD
jgi:uncharacterized protein (TIGR02058 family)